MSKKIKVSRVINESRIYVENATTREEADKAAQAYFDKMSFPDYMELVFERKATPGMVEFHIYEIVEN